MIRAFLCITVLLGTLVAGSAFSQSGALKALPLREVALIERFAKTPRPRKPLAISLSPEAAHFVYALSGEGGRSELRLVSVATRRSAVLTTSGPDLPASRLEEHHVAAFQWSHDGSRVAFLDSRKEPFDLIVWNVHSPSAPARVSLASLATKLPGSEIDDWIWLSETNELLLGVMPRQKRAPAGRYSTADAWSWQWSREQQMQSAGAESAVVDANRPLRIFRLSLGEQELREVTPKDTALSAARRIPHNGSLWKLSPDRRRIYFSVGDPVLGDEAAYVVSEFKLWLLRTKDPRGAPFASATNRLMEWDLDTDRVKAAYVGGPGRIAGIVVGKRDADIHFLEESVELANWPARGRWARLRSLRESGRDGPEPALLDWPVFASDLPGSLYQFDAGAKQRLLETNVRTGEQRVLSPEAMAVTHCSVSADGGTIAAVMQNVSTPPSVHLWTRRRGWQKVMAFPDPLPDLGVGEMEHITWRSQDDRFDIQGIVVKPRDFDPSRRYPLIVYGRGGRLQSYAPYLNVFDPWVGDQGIPVHLYAAAGYLVLLPNHRGIEDHSAEFGEAHVGHLGDNYDRDIDAGVDELIRRGWADASRLAIIGHSAGGTLVSYAISHTQRYRAAIIEDGLLALPDLSSVTGTYGNSNLVHGHDAIARTIGFDPLHRAFIDPSRIRTPLLLRYSSFATFRETDSSAPLARLQETFSARNQAERFLTELTANGVAVEVIADRSRHVIDLSSRYALEYVARTLQWLDFFVMGTGTNPIPALPADLDYSKEIEEYLQRSERARRLED